MLLLEGPQNCQFGNHEAGFPPHVLDILKFKKGNGAARTTTGLWGRACILEFYVASSGPPTVKFKHGYGFGCLCDGNSSGAMQPTMRTDSYEQAQYMEERHHPHPPYSDTQLKVIFAPV